MKRFLILSALVLLPVLACTQSRVAGLQNIEWDGLSDSHEVAIQAGSGQIIILGETTELEYSFDLKTLGHYGLYAVLVRGVQFTEPDMYDYSEWIRSDNPEDVILVDGEPMTFLIESKFDAIKPTMIRIKE